MTVGAPRTAPVGMVGLGHIGLAFADLLIKAGRDVLGYRRHPDGALEALGGRTSSSLDSLVEACAVIILALPDVATAQSVLETVAAGGHPTKVLINATSVTPEAARRFEQIARAAGHAYLDAPVSGAAPQVRAHGGTILAGGDDALFQSQRELLSVLASRTLHVGSVGAASALKQAALMIIAINTLGLAEALAFAESFGVAPHHAVEALSAGPTASAALSMRGPWMATQDYAPRIGRLEDFLSLLTALSAAATTPTGLLDQVREYLDQACNADLGGRDVSAAFEILRARS